MKLVEYKAPCGQLLLGVNGQNICLCDWMVGDRIEKSIHRINKYLPATRCRDDEGLLNMAADLLDEYFSGECRKFEIPLAFYGTGFQRRVWEALCQIPYGETVSYKTIAKALGVGRGVRAVASAIAANPLSIVVPCHRVIGANGTLTGYAGGIEVKRFLLQLESRRFQDGPDTENRHVDYNSGLFK